MSVCALVLACASGPGTIAAGGHDASRGRVHARRCRAPAHAKVLVRDRRLVMWRSFGIVRSRYQEPERAEFFDACVPPHGATRLLSREGLGGPVQCGGDVSFESAGSYVAILSGEGCSSGWQNWLGVEDVLDGRERPIVAFGASTGSSPEVPSTLAALGPPFGVGIQRFTVDAHGDVAWLAATEPESGRGEAAAEVLYVDDLAGTRRAAVAPSIGHVAFHGSQLTWRALGAAHSTTG